MTADRVDDLDSLPAEALDHFVYVVGMARGGTSVIRDAMDIHDKILMLPGMTHFMNQVWRYRHKVHDRLLRQIFQLPEFYREEAVMRDLDREKSRALQVYVQKAFASRDLKRMWQIYPVVYALDRENTGSPKEVTCWGDKANDFYGLEEVYRSFPLGKFIFVLRDPRGVAASIAKRTAVKKEASYDAPVEEEELIRASISWRNMTQRMLRFSRRHREKALLVRFEDFLKNPVEKLNEIFIFVTGMTLPADVIESRVEALGYGATNVPDERGRGLSKAPLERWKENLNEKQVERIQAITGETAREAGYRLEGSLSPATVFRVILSAPSLKEKAIRGAKLAYLRMLAKRM